MTGRLSKNFHGVGIGPLSKMLAVNRFGILRRQVTILRWLLKIHFFFSQNQCTSFDRNINTYRNNRQCMLELFLALNRLVWWFLQLLEGHPKEILHSPMTKSMMFCQHFFRNDKKTNLLEHIFIHLVWHNLK